MTVIEQQIQELRLRVESLEARLDAPASRTHAALREFYPLAERLIMRHFQTDSPVAFNEEIDPDSGLEYVAMSVQIGGGVEDFLRAYQPYHAELLATVPAWAAERLRLLYQLG